MLSPVRLTAPAARVVTWEDADRHLRLDGDTDEKALVESLIDSATAHLDGWAGILGRCLINQQWRADFCDWPARRVLRLPFPDVSAATVKYFDETNVEQTIPSGSVAILRDARSSFVRLSDEFAKPGLRSDRGDPVQVTFTAGYGAAASDVPQPIRVAILMHVSALYRHREAAGQDALEIMPYGYEALLAPYRVYT